MDLPSFPFEDDPSFTQIPDWFDREKIESARKFYKRFLMSVYMSCLSGLYILLSIPTISTTLDFTEKSNSPLKSFKRYRRTMESMNLWYTGEIFNPTDKAYTSLKKLRKIHYLVQQKQEKIQGEKSFSQLDFALTQFAFFGPMLLYPKKLGISCEEKDFVSVIHFWRCVGYLLGIDDENNLCCGSLDETKEKCRRMVKEIFIPALENPSSGFSEISQNMLEGSKMIVPFIDCEGYKAFSLNLLGLNYLNLTWNSKLKFKFQKFICEVLLFVGIVREFFNSAMAKALKASWEYYELLENQKIVN